MPLQVAGSETVAGRHLPVVGAEIDSACVVD